MTDEDHHAHPLEEEDRLTPRGRHWFEAVVIVVGALVLVSIWIAWHRLSHNSDQNLAADGSELPSSCATDTQSTWYGATTGHVLDCVAEPGEDARYRIAFRCGIDGSLKVGLGFYTRDGSPRMPAWKSSPAGKRLMIDVAAQGLPATQLALLQTDAASRGEIADFPPALLSRLLAARGIVVSGAFPGETATFDLDHGRWYVDYFQSSCEAVPGPG